MKLGLIFLGIMIISGIIAYFTESMEGLEIGYEHE